MQHNISQYIDTFIL